MGVASSDRRRTRPERGIVAFDDPRLAVDLHRREVEGMMDDGVSFDEVEDVIEDADLALDEKAALWLLAWSFEEPHIQRARARTTLQLLTTRPRLDFGGAGVAARS